MLLNFHQMINQSMGMTIKMLEKHILSNLTVF